MADDKWVWGLGRRKTSVARVRITPGATGSGKIVVNGKKPEEYFKTGHELELALLPLSALDLKKKYDVYVNVNGGGLAGQAGAVMMGVARALKEDDSELEPKLREEGFLSRDPRMSERKKPGQRGARARFQFSKR